MLKPWNVHPDSLAELLLPLTEHGSRDEEKCRLGFASQQQLAQDEASFDRLAQSDFIR